MDKTLFIILYNFITGTLCLMFGVKLLSNGLEQSNIKFIEKLITLFTRSLIPACITGTVVTALVQSSTAVTVITVGFVNSGLMKLTQAVGIIYGANIGTTITAQLMSFKIGKIAIPALVLGLIMRFLSKRRPVKKIGAAVMGFGLMFIGINILSSGAPYIKESRFAHELFKTYGENPYIGLVIGMITTMLVHSSSATVGLTIVLFNAGLISFDAAIGLTLGDNIGTCITAQLASIGTNTAARRTAWAHTLYNVIGVLIALALLVPFERLVQNITFLMGQNETRLVANTHTIFNILSAAVFLPITKYYVRFIEWLIPPKK
jgi:phosphate:Na+ symporter